MLPKLGITPGFALDLTVNDEDGQPWDFTKEDKKIRAMELAIETEPDLITGSPPCTDFSPWQRLNKAMSSNPEKYVQSKEKAVEHLKFTCDVYKLQHRNGRLFLHEHP